MSQVIICHQFAAFHQAQAYYVQNQYGFMPASFLPLQAPPSSAPFLPSTSYETETKENRGSFKVKLCLHFSRSGTCSKGTKCGFAHGAHELQATPETLARRAINQKHKTRLCDNYARGGSGDCPYKGKCEFIHPSDKEYHTVFYADTEEFAREQNAFKNKVQEQHLLKGQDPLNEHFFDQKIMLMIKNWNKTHPLGPNYFDFHGLTLAMAEQYLKEIIRDMLANNVNESRIEVGRGRHSVNGIPMIKKMILGRYQGYCGAKFVPEKGNDGILVLTFN